MANRHILRDEYPVTAVTLQYAFDYHLFSHFECFRQGRESHGEVRDAIAEHECVIREIQGLGKPPDLHALSLQVLRGREDLARGVALLRLGSPEHYDHEDDHYDDSSDGDPLRPPRNALGRRRGIRPRFLSPASFHS